MAKLLEKNETKAFGKAVLGEQSTSGYSASRLSVVCLLTVCRKQLINYQLGV